MVVEIIQSIAIFSVGKAGGAEGAMVVGVSSTDIIIMASEYPTTRQGGNCFYYAIKEAVSSCRERGKRLKWSEDYLSF